MGEKREFTVNIQKLGRVSIPKPVREALDLGMGDRVKMTVQKDEGGKEPELRER